MKLIFRGYYSYVPGNTDDKTEDWSSILVALGKLDLPVVLPLHPRTKKLIDQFELESKLANLNIIPPATYLDMLVLEKNARAIITDSGGVQKEAFLARRPCFTIRSETEWEETINAGWNKLVEPEQLGTAMRQFIEPETWPNLYGDGQATARIVKILQNASY